MGLNDAITESSAAKIIKAVAPYLPTDVEFDKWQTLIITFKREGNSIAIAQSSVAPTRPIGSKESTK